MHWSMRTRLVAGLATTVTVVALLSAPPASAASTGAVINQVYGGGGNSGATFTNDFIELRNLGSTPLDLTGWSVQYASAAGTTWQVTPLTGTIPAGGFYLVQEAAGATVVAPLPTPDAVGSIPMSATNGKVALVSSTTQLACGADCDTAAGVVDFVGYGTANDFEAAAAPGLSNTTAAQRVDGPDTDNNAADFTATGPDPRNSSSEPPPPPPPPATRIREVQGAAHRSPVDGGRADVPGIVTAVAARGFYLQDPEPDADPATSEAVFVFTSGAPTVLVGDRVRVAGRVTEFRPGGDDNNLTTTEITVPVVSIVERGVALPAPTLVGPGGRVAPPAIRTDAPGDVEASPVFDVTANALDFYESLEAMLVRVVDAVATGPTSDFGELAVLPGGAGGPRTVRGGIRYTYADPNTERVILDDALAPMPDANTGDRLPGAIDAVVDYSFANFKFFVLATPTVVAGNLPRERTRVQRSGELAIATYNVENLDPGDPIAKFDRLAAGIVTSLSSPDIVTLEEVQDDNGPVNDAVVSAGATYALLIEAIVRAGGPRYEVRQIDPTDDADGGEPGGNIRVAFLFRTDRGLSFVDIAGGDAVTPTGVVRDGFLRARLTASPGRIDPLNPAFANSRKPLAGQFRYHGRNLFVVANHFNSKGGDQPLFGRFQPPVRASEAQRHAQALAVRAFHDRIRAIEPLASIVVLGDINDFEFSRTADILVGDGWLLDLPRWLPPAERYTYVFEGNSQVLDHILISLPLALRGFEYDIVHLNAEYADQASDHDPQVVRVRP